MKISNYIIGVLVISLVLIAGSRYANDFATAYGVDVTDLSHLNQTAPITETIDQMTDSIARVDQKSESLIDDVWNFVGFSSVTLINTATLFIRSPFLLLNMLTNSEDTGLLQIIMTPDFIISIIMTIILALISFAVYRTISKSDI